VIGKHRQAAAAHSAHSGCLSGRSHDRSRIVRAAEQPSTFQCVYNYGCTQLDLLRRTSAPKAGARDKRRQADLGARQCIHKARDAWATLTKAEDLHLKPYLAQEGARRLCWNSGHAGSVLALSGSRFISIARRRLGREHRAFRPARGRPRGRSIVDHRAICARHAPFERCGRFPCPEVSQSGFLARSMRVARSCA